MARGLALLIALFATGPVSAWPADVYVDLAPETEEFRRLTAVAWAEVEDPAIAGAEVLPSGELLLSGKAPGRTLVLLYAEGKFAVWRVRVGAVPSPDAQPLLAAAKKACGKGFTADKERLATPVPDESCRKALLSLFETDRYSARDVELTFELPALQAQLADMQSHLAAKKLEGARLSYRGAGLVLEGALSPGEHRKALWELFRRSAGRVPLDDRTELLTPPDGGAGEKP